MGATEGATVMQELDYNVRNSFTKLVQVGVWQYCLIAFLANVVEVLAKLWDWFNPKSCIVSLRSLIRFWLPEYAVSLQMNETMLEHKLHKPPASFACEDLWA